MSQDLSKFDKFKRNLGDKWHSVSVYDIEGQEELIIDGFKAYIFTLLNKNLNSYAYIKRLFKRAKQELLLFKITENLKSKSKKIEKNLENFLESE